MRNSTSEKPSNNGRIKILQRSRISEESYANSSLVSESSEPSFSILTKEKDRNRAIPLIQRRIGLLLDASDKCKNEENTNGARHKFLSRIKFNTQVT